jgi:hypothetical protein
VLGVGLPVLGDLDVQVEIDRRTEQGLDLAAGVGADVAQPGPLVADHDALLAVALEEDVGVDVEQRLVVRPALAQHHLVDGDGDRVRQLVPNAFQRGLADQLADQDLLRLVRHVAVRVERLADGQELHQLVRDDLDLVPRGRRHRDDRGPLDADGLPQRLDL